VRIFIRKMKPNDAVVLLDTFLMPTWVAQNDHPADRYFTGFKNYLNESDLRKVWIAPVLLDFVFDTIKESYKKPKRFSF